MLQLVANKTLIAWKIETLQRKDQKADLPWNRLKQWSKQVRFKKHIKLRRNRRFLYDKLFNIKMLICKSNECYYFVNTGQISISISIFDPVFENREKVLSNEWCVTCYCLQLYFPRKCRYSRAFEHMLPLVEKMLCASCPECLLLFPRHSVLLKYFIHLYWENNPINNDKFMLFGMLCSMFYRGYDNQYCILYILRGIINRLVIVDFINDSGRC